MQTKRTKAQRFEDLEVWQKAHQLVLGAYRVTRTFPPEERFGLVAQLRRAAVSIPSNIAEGFKRRTLKDKKHFYNLTQGSAEEVRYYLILSRDLQFVPDVATLLVDVDRMARMLHALICALEA